MSTEYIDKVRDGQEKTISKQHRKITQMLLTHEHLHERLARLTSSLKNSKLQIKRMKKYLADRFVCDRCGHEFELSREQTNTGDPIYYECECDLQINSDMDFSEE